MRGRRDGQQTMLAFIDLEERAPTGHPLRTIKRLADEALVDLSSTFDQMYAKEGRPSISPEWLLNASLLIGLYSVRSERAFCEELEHNLPFRWLLDMDKIRKRVEEIFGWMKTVGGFRQAHNRAPTAPVWPDIWLRPPTTWCNSAGYPRDRARSRPQPDPSHQVGPHDGDTGSESTLWEQSDHPSHPALSA